MDAEERGSEYSNKQQVTGNKSELGSQESETSSQFSVLSGPLRRFTLVALPLVACRRVLAGQRPRAKSQRLPLS